MNTLNERLVLGAIECHELFGEHDSARKLRNEYNSEKKKNQKRKSEIMFEKDKIFEGTLVAAGWDKLDHVNQSSLYTQEDEDILLEHNSGIKKFKPYLNEKVRVLGDIISSNRDGRRVLVKKISRLLDCSTRPLRPLRDEFNNFLTFDMGKKYLC